MDDVDLKNLLDEAYTYKSPKDRAQKSAMFNVSIQIGYQCVSIVLIISLHR